MSVPKPSSGPLDAELDRLLEMIEGHVDLAHCAEVDRRYRAVLACESVDRPPLVVRPPFATRLQLPEPWNRFAADHGAAGAVHQPPSAP